MNQYRRKKSLI